MDQNTGSEDYLDNLPLQRFLTYRLLRVHAKLNAQAIRRLKEVCGLSLSHWRVLAMIAVNPGATSTRISRLSDIDKGQLSRCVKAMSAEGLLRVEDDNSDQRQQHLHLTDMGQDLYDTTVPRMRARQRYLLGQLTPQERDLFYTVLDKLEIAAETLDIPE